MSQWSLVAFAGPFPNMGTKGEKTQDVIQCISDHMSYVTLIKVYLPVIIQEDELYM